MSITDALERIERWAVRNDPQFVALLRPGLTRRKIETLTADLPFPLPEEVYQLYGWHDGQAPGAFRLGLFGFRSFRLQPLRRTVGEYRTYEKTYWFSADTLSFEFRKESQERAGEAAGWLPLFFAGDENHRRRDCFRNHYLLVLTVGSAAPLVWHPGDDGHAQAAFPSLTAMLEYRAETYEAGAVRFDEDSNPYSDYALTSEIKRRLFPERAAQAERAYDALPATATGGQRIAAMNALVRSGSPRAVAAVTADLPALLGGNEHAERVTQELLTSPITFRQRTWNSVPKFLYAKFLAEAFLAA